MKVLDIANTLINIQKERKTAGMVLQHFYYSFTVLLNIEQSFPWLSARLKESLNKKKKTHIYKKTDLFPF